MADSISGLSAVFWFSALVCACGGSTRGSDAGDGGAENTTFSPTCPMITPCGGDLVGDWQVKEVCLGAERGTSEFSGCPEAIETPGPLKRTGTYSFNADGSETLHYVVTSTSTIQLPTSCFTEAECQEYADVLTDVSLGGLAGSCRWDEVTGCACRRAVSNGVAGDGTYQVQGSSLIVINGITRSTSEASFCVSGNTLSISEIGGNGWLNTMTLTR